jgi:HEAT repeat protein
VGDWKNELISGDEIRAENAAINPPSNKREALSILEDLLSTKDATFRWWACRSLSEIKSNAAGQLLTSCLSDKDLSIQRCAAIGLRISPMPEALDQLIYLLINADSLTQRLAGDALIALERKATESLLEVLEKSKENSRVEAARALAKIADPKSISSLFALLESESQMLEHYASEGLEKMGIGMQFFSTLSE